MDSKIMALHLIVSAISFVPKLADLLHAMKNGKSKLKMPSFSTPALCLSAEKAEPLHAKLLPPLYLGNSYPGEKEEPLGLF